MWTAIVSVAFGVIVYTIYATWSISNSLCEDTIKSLISQAERMEKTYDPAKAKIHPF